MLQSASKNVKSASTIYGLLKIERFLGVSLTPGVEDIIMQNG
jgi:hypothetical protein